jgi:ABC-type branched-subunit amino acid transport system permease subunit
VIAGLGGILYLYQDLAITPGLFTALALVSLPLMVILGGVLSPTGPLVGALVLSLVPHFLNFNTNAETYVYGAIIIVLMLGAQSGLVPYVDDLWLRLAAAVRRHLGSDPEAPDGLLVATGEFVPRDLSVRK